MKVKYDQEVDVLTIQLSGAPVEESGSMKTVAGTVGCFMNDARN
jgi:hypothetical protein